MKTFSCKIHDITFNARAEEPLYPQVQTLFQTIQAIPAKNIRNGYSIEFGFTVFFLVEKGNEYCIVAPDYKKYPYSDTTEDLTIALWIQLEQAHLLRLYNLECEGVRFDDKVIVAKNALQENAIYLQRFSNCGKGDSGWCIKPVEHGEAGDFEAYYAYQLLSIRPALIKALILPYEYIVIFEGDTIVSIMNEQDEDIIGT